MPTVEGRAIIDERYNQGGKVAEYIVNELDRKPRKRMKLLEQSPVRHVPRPAPF